MRNRRTLRWTAVRVLTVAALAVATTVTGSAATSATDRGRAPARVGVLLTGDDIVLTTDRVARSVTTFTVRTTAPGIGSFQVLKPRRGVPMATVLARLELLLDDAPLEVQARSSDFLDRNVTWFGGVDVFPGRGGAVTMTLDEGTYVLIDVAQGLGPGELTTVRPFRVTSGSGGGLPKADARIEMREGDDDHAGHVTAGDDDGHAFRASDRLPAKGVVEVRNKNAVHHFAALAPVRPGTTDADIQERYDAFLSGEEPSDDPFLDGPSASMNVLSEGKRAQLTYDLPPGTYVILCFIPDEVNGLPHALLGMHKVVELR